MGRPNPLEDFQARLPLWWSEVVLATRGWLVFLLSLPALLATIISLAKSNLLGIVVNATAFSLYLLVFVLLRRGARAEKDRQGKILAERSRPYKWMAAGIAALTTMGMARFGAGHPATVSALFGFGAFVGMYLAYGLEHRASNADVVPEVAGIDRDEVLRILEDAERRILNIDRAGRKIGNPELALRVGRISTIAKNILVDLNADPREIRRSRKFLNVYLDGVEKVVAGYARTHAQVQSEQLEGNFRNVLTAIEDTFQEQRQRLLDNDVFDLDVQMEVLSTQLKREGIS